MTFVFFFWTCIVVSGMKSFGSFSFGYHRFLNGISSQTE